MIRSLTLIVAIIASAVAYYTQSDTLAFAIYSLAIFMIGWTISWPFAQAAMIGDVVYEEYDVVFTPFDDDDEGEQ